MSGFSNRPKILRGAFVEYGLTLPPLVVVFQYNPTQLTRSRELKYKVPASSDVDLALRDFHFEHKNLTDIRNLQQVEVGEETITLEIRLDATDDLEQGDAITSKFGIAPRLATLELMAYPKDESLVGQALSRLSARRFSFTRGENPPMILFVWGRFRVLPVNIASMTITETVFSPTLNPLRASVNMTLNVIEGKNVPYGYTKLMKEVASALNLANITDIANVVVPG